MASLDAILDFSALHHLCQCMSVVLETTDPEFGIGHVPILDKYIHRLMCHNLEKKVYFFDFIMLVNVVFVLVVKSHAERVIFTKLAPLFQKPCLQYASGKL